MNGLNSMLVLPAAFLAVFLESALDGPRNFLGAQIDLLPALMVYAGLSQGIAAVSLLALCGGLWFDSLSANPLGASVLPLLAIGLFICHQKALVLRDELFAQLAVGFMASALAPLLTVMLLLSAGQRPLIGWGSLWQWLVMAVGGAAFTPLFFQMFSRLKRFLNYQALPESTFHTNREMKRGRT